MALLLGNTSSTIGESVMVNLDHVSLDNQSRYSLGVIEFPSELCDRLFADTIEIIEKYHKLNPACHKTVL